MRISYVINTAAGDPHASGGNPHRSARYNARYNLLKGRVLPSAMEQGFDEVIVAGCYEPGDGYRYLPVAPRCRDRRDALWQRELGARHSTGDILVFGHDDHSLAPDFGHALKWHMEEDNWDLLIPRRIHGITGATLNNGFEDGPLKKSYMGGHCLVMRRWLWAEVGWLEQADNEWWDCTMTRRWKEAGGRLVFSDTLIHVDVEAAAHES